MSSIERSQPQRPSLLRRLSSVLMLSASLVTGSISPAVAHGRHRGGAAHHAATRPATHGRTGNVNTGHRHNTRHTNVDNRHANVDVNRRDVNVYHNTVVRPAPRPYTRAPYAYGGRSYYAYHPYYYHPYRAYGWGPGYHPFGAFVVTVAATAIVVSVANQRYRYDQGVWYAPSNGGYVVVTAPVGATVTTLPPSAVMVSPNNYYYGGTYYERTGGDYKVVAPIAGTVVEHLPDGAKQVTVGDQKYMKIGETYYQPIQQDGKDMYEVVEVK